MVASPNNSSQAIDLLKIKRQLVKNIGKKFLEVEKILMNQCYHTPKVKRAHAGLMLAFNEVVDSVLIDFAVETPTERPSGVSQLTFEGIYTDAPQ